MNPLRKIAREVLLKSRNEGRYVLERKIFPNIRGKKILLVGCEHYTSDYPKRLKGSEVWTIDINPKSAEFGSKNHITGDFLNSGSYFKDSKFDVIVLAGVIGYGINSKTAVDKSLRVCYNLLNSHGLLFIQWTNKPKKNNVDPKSVKNFNLFTPKGMYGYSSSYETSDKRVWEFLVKK